MAVTAAVASAVLAAGLALRHAAPVTGGLALLGAAYCASLFLSDADLDTTAPFFASGLFLVAELAFWSTERRRVPAGGSYAARRFARIVGFTLAAVVIGAVVLAAATAAVGTDPLLDLVGAAAAVAAVALVAAVARRR